MVQLITRRDYLVFCPHTYFEIRFFTNPTSSLHASQADIQTKPQNRMKPNIQSKEKFIVF